MQVVNKIGRRKTAIARIYMKPGTGEITVNGRAFTEYFPLAPLQIEALKPFEITNTKGQFDLKINVNGGGIAGQAGAIKMALARALDAENPEFHTALKAEGLFTRDPRMVERKKFGRSKARKRFQFSKR